MKATYKFKIGTLIALIGFNACSESNDCTDDSLDNQVSVSSITVQVPRANEQAPQGNYYFGWSSKQNQVSYTPVAIDNNGKIGEGGKINAYWDNIDRSKGVTFSNSLDIKETDNVKTPIDILWGKINNPIQSGLAFILDHKMAQAQVELTIPNAWKVNEIWFTDLQTQYSFSNANGNITACGDAEKIGLGKITASEDTKVTSSILLPPQDKGDDSELYVLINDGREDRTFHRKLPTAMAEDLGSGQWQDILLKFRAGYRLILTATITDNSDGEIHFTYATLEDWVNKGSGTISARPAGIYTVADWNAFATAYNEKDVVHLRKYGTYVGDKWTFTLQRSIIFTGTGTVTQANLAGDDKLTAKSGCTITGKTADELGVKDHSDDDIFKNN